MIGTTSHGWQQHFAKKPGTPGRSLSELSKALREPEGWKEINKRLKALVTIKADLERRLAELKPSYRRYSSISRQLEKVNKEIDNLMAALRTAVNMNKWSD